MFRLDLNFMNTEDESALVKMSAYYDDVGTCMMRTSNNTSFRMK